MQRNRSRWTVLAAAASVALLGGANAAAQDVAPKTVKSSGTQDESPSPVAKVRNEMRAMRSDKASADELAAKVPGWLATLFSAADAATKPDERFDALALAIDVSLISRDDDAAAEKRKLAIERLLGEFVDDQAKMSALLGTRAAVDGLRGKVLERTKSNGVKAVCVYGEAAELVMKARSEKLPEADEKRMYALLERAAGEFGAEKDSKGRLFKDVARGAARSVRDLLVGKVAPEIEGHDLDGAAFKLSDYRGKVVVLDFWGNW